jgi:hypothetical protein
LTPTRRIEKKSGARKAPAEHVIKDIRRATRKQFSAEEKIRIVLEGLRELRAKKQAIQLVDILGVLHRDATSHPTFATGVERLLDSA